MTEKKYPKGKIRPDDEGELDIEVAIDKKSNRILINFNKPVHWIGLDAGAAKVLADTLKEKIKDLTKSLQ